MERYKFGDLVHWSTKVEGEPPIQRAGLVVAIVPPGADPLEVVPKGYSVKTIDNKTRKDHESYIIVSGERLYWPPVGKLRAGDVKDED